MWTPPAALDLAPLHRAVTFGEARRFEKDAIARGQLQGTRRRTRVVRTVIAGILAMFVIVGGVVVLALTGDPDQQAALAVFGVLIGVILVVAAFEVVRRVRARAFRPRFDSFARANRLVYVPDVRDPQLPGSIFHVGWTRYALDVLRGGARPDVEFGNYRCTTGQRDGEAHWGYIGIRLDVPLPHIVLVSSPQSSLPVVLDPDQRLSLEGDFDRHFRLHCPKGYERDALYLFTPDVMARFIDSASGIDVEIVDDWLFLYTSRDVVTLRDDRWRDVMSLATVMVERTRRWSRWRDAAAPRLEVVTAVDGSTVVGLAPTSAPTVGAAGRRLRGHPVLFVVGTLFSIATIVLIQYLVHQIH